MSVATRFKYYRPFPFCPTDLSGVDVHASYVDNLTLAEVMAFAWNLETFTLTMEGSASVPDPLQIAQGDCELVLNPAASTVHNFFQQNGPGMFYGDLGTSDAIATGSFPSIRTPRERVCFPDTAATGTLLDIGFSDLDPPDHHSGFIYFKIGTDPANTGKYRLYYRFSFLSSDTLSETIQVGFRNNPTLGGWTAWNSGTITIGGIVMTWYSFYTPGATPSGSGTMSATSSFFTYP